MSKSKPLDDEARVIGTLIGSETAFKDNERESMIFCNRLLDELYTSAPQEALDLVEVALNFRFMRYRMALAPLYAYHEQQKLRKN